MELEVRHLRALCAIADTGSLHRAARQLSLPLAVEAAPAPQPAFARLPLRDSRPAKFR